jgi:hypothetical protein
METIAMPFEFFHTPRQHVFVTFEGIGFPTSPGGA